MSIGFFLSKFVKTQETMELSILICTIPGIFRSTTPFESLIDTLNQQTGGKAVEVLYLGDMMRMSVGAKRNRLMKIASGSHLCFIDDDDKISDNYVDKMLEWRNLGKDVVSIPVIMTSDGGNLKKYDYSYSRNINFKKAGISYAGRVPNHLCLWKTEIANRIQFEEINLGEDHLWADKQLRHGYTIEHRFNEDSIYHYDFSKLNTKTRNRR